MPARVLVVEDDELMGELVGDVLELAGFERKLATTGRQAILLCKDWEPDALVLDLMLPDISGLEVCKEIRSMQPAADPSVLMLTACHDHSRRTEAFSAGVDEFVQKPFLPSKLNTDLQTLISRTEIERREGMCRKIERQISTKDQFDKLMQELPEQLGAYSPAPLGEIEAVALCVTRIGAEWLTRSPNAAWIVQIKLFRDHFEFNLREADNSDAKPPAHSLVPLPEDLIRYPDRESLHIFDNATGLAFVHRYQAQK